MTAWSGDAAGKACLSAPQSLSEPCLSHLTSPLLISKKQRAEKRQALSSLDLGPKINV